MSRIEEKSNWPYWQILALITLIVAEAVGLGHTASGAISREDNPRPVPVPRATVYGQPGEAVAAVLQTAAANRAVNDLLKLQKDYIEQLEQLVGLQKIEINLLKN